MMGGVAIITVLGVFLGFVLGFADKFLKVEVDSRVEKINELLPQYNCGACGHPGCMGLAEAIVAQSGKVSDCKPIKPDAKEAIYEYIETAEGPDGEKIELSKVK
ncbi:RnfABCDGE type electron transport complex subunit B [Erysipelotrichaceae bacterium OttesenSCG-928-M19]|nr:RnfABCDGE type electron transport complex subunit B [Erysipelotrichaceae bacterium OttesenSCG-928-M19]